MYSTQVFLYTQRNIVVLLSGFSARSYMPQYAKPLTLHKGVDNQIQFQFLNQEQKPVNITGKVITCRIINYEGSMLLISKSLTLDSSVDFPANGIASLYLSIADLADIEVQKCYYSLEFSTANAALPVFVDQNAGARGEMNIVNSVLPSFIPSMQITIPTGQSFPNTSYLDQYGNYYGNANNIIYYTSVINTDGIPVVSLQASYEQFNGNVVIEGSTIVDGDWYPASPVYSYANVTDTVGYTVRGYHPYIRMQFASNAGVVTNIWSR